MASNDMAAIEKAYNDSALLLSERILALIPENLQIMDFVDPSQLFKVKGFTCDDIGPSYFMASWALSRAKYFYKEQHAC
jgi:hypothetical protein